MRIEIKTIKEIEFHLIHQCIAEAFSDYQIDMTYMTEERLLLRALKNRLNFESSVGAFDNNKLVGCTLVGIDTWQNVQAAFDITTGIIKQYRGQGLAQQMFNYALPILQAQHVKKFVLEVLQDNNPAMKAYQKSGFKITRKFNCFMADKSQLKKPNLSTQNNSIQQIDKNELLKLSDFNDWEPSWEQNFSALKNIQDELITFAWFNDNKIDGFISYYPTLNWIINFGINPKHRKKQIASMLMSHLLDFIWNDIQLVKCTNILESDVASHNFLEKFGFSIYTRQYEMIKDLN